VKHELTILLLLLAVLLVSGCFNGTQASPYTNTTPGKTLYNLEGASRWTYTVAMNASNTTSTWNMTVDNDKNDPRHMVITTVGNGMNIVYDIWWNKSTYQITRMHANGTTGNNYQNRDVSPMQIYTLPDSGLTYYFVPFQRVGTINAKSPDGQLTPATIYSATDNKGFSVTYLVHPNIPLPIRIDMNTADFKIRMMLTDYK